MRVNQSVMTLNRSGSNIPELSMTTNTNDNTDTDTDADTDTDTDTDELQDPEESVSVDLVGRTIPTWSVIDDIPSEEFQDDAELTIALAARGDYYPSSLEESSLEEIFSGVSYDDRHIDLAADVGLIPDDITIVDEPYYDIQCKKVKLIERLFRRNHWGVFEHAFGTFFIDNVSRVTMAQIRTHRHASFDVQSQRYVDFADTDASELFTTPRSVVVPDHFTREGDSDMTPTEMKRFREKFTESVQRSKQDYNELVESMPPEDARMCLPTAATVHMTMSLSLRSILHIMDMRSTADAQWEIRAVSNQMLEELHEWCPVTAALYKKHGPFACSP